MAPAYVKNVALFGGSGNVGKYILSSLIEADRFNITVVSRQDSEAAFPSSVTVRKVDYDDNDSLVEALKGQEAVVIALAFTAPPEIQTRIIDAAAEAKVPFVIPNEYGSDNANVALREAVPMNAAKTKYRNRVEELGVSSWIAIVCNPWYDHCLPVGFYSIDVNKKEATVYDGGDTKSSATTKPTTGLAVARLLALPITPEKEGQASLSKYKNNFVYISSFHTSQNEIISAVQKATSTTPADWTVKSRTADDYIDEGRRGIQAGNMTGMVAVLFGMTMKKGGGGDYESTVEMANDTLGLPREDIYAVTKSVLA